MGRPLGAPFLFNTPREGVAASPSVALYSIMQLLLITLLALVAFAANSVLARVAMAHGAIDPASFTGLRLVSGALTLALLVGLRRGNPLALGSWPSALALLIYAAAFSFAYVTLDAGLGALILFAAVQITMFGGALIGGERPHPGRWAGMALGLTGLAVLFLPGATAPSPIGAGLMLGSGIGWGVYSLRGRHGGDALGATAGNFLRASPFAIAIWLLAGQGGANLEGVALAIASGALASGLGYAVWYTALPRLDASLAAIAQLTVPIIALSGGMLWLGEAADWSFALASTLILGGVGLAVLFRRA